MSTATEPARPRCFPPGDVMHESAYNLRRHLGGYSSIIERNANMAKRNYYKVPKNVSEMTEEELEVFALAIYEHMMAKFAEVQPGLFMESSES
jgi:hypothetical protein